MDTLFPEEELITVELKKKTIQLLYFNNGYLLQKIFKHYPNIALSNDIFFVEKKNEFKFRRLINRMKVPSFFFV